jgi:hypothetical protein
VRSGDYVKIVVQPTGATVDLVNKIGWVEFVIPSDWLSVYIEELKDSFLVSKYEVVPCKPN